jgi:hypothetical protein
VRICIISEGALIAGRPTTTASSSSPVPLATSVFEGSCPRSRYRRRRPYLLPRRRPLPPSKAPSEPLPPPILLTLAPPANFISCDPALHPAPPANSVSSGSCCRIRLHPPPYTNPAPAATRCASIAHLCRTLAVTLLPPPSLIGGPPQPRPAASRRLAVPPTIHRHCRSTTTPRPPSATGEHHRRTPTPNLNNPNPEKTSSGGEAAEENDGGVTEKDGRAIPGLYLGCFRLKWPPHGFKVVARAFVARVMYII